MPLPLFAINNEEIIEQEYDSNKENSSSLENENREERQDGFNFSN